MSLVYWALGWAVGIIISRAIEPPLVLPISLFGCTLVGGWLYRHDHHLRVFWVTVAFFSLGMLRFDLARPERAENHVLHLNDLGGQMTLVGVVVAEPETLDQGRRLLLETEQAAGKPVQGRVLVTVSRTSTVNYGDRVQVFGVLRTPPEFDTFSYSDYLARQGVFSVMFNAEVDVLAEGQGFEPYAQLLKAKNSARDFITETLPEPHAALLVGMLLGDESGLSDEVRDDFNRTGTSHLIAISGFNMTILAQVVMSLFQRLMSKQKAAYAGLAVIILYTIFVGAGAAVLRAAFMSSLLIIAQLLHRRTYVPASLAGAALFMSLLDPWVLWDVGFQLSLAAVLGMALFVKPLQRALETGLTRLATPETTQTIVGFLSDSVIVTLAAQLTTAPIILFYFGRLSVVSLGVNFLVIPVQSYLLLFGAAGVLVGLAVPPLGEILLNITWLFLTWTVEIVQGAASLSWADTQISLNGAVLLGYLGLLGGVMWVQAVRPKWAKNLFDYPQLPARVLQVGGLLVFAVLVSQNWQRPDDRLHVTFLEVGSSNGVLLQTPKGGTILMDGGELPTRLLDQLGERLPARQRRIDTLILTSTADEDLTALLEVVERYEIGAVITNGQDSANEVYVALLEKLTAKNVPIVPVSAGYELVTDDGVTLQILSPTTPPDAAAEPEIASLVLRISYKQSVFLLPNANTLPTEEILLQHPHLIQATVLQIPANGSGEAGSAAFISTVNPQVAILQIDPTEDPNPSVMSRLQSAQVFRTDEGGQVEIITDGETLEVYRHE